MPVDGHVRFHDRALAGPTLDANALLAAREADRLFVGDHGVRREMLQWVGGFGFLDEAGLDQATPWRSLRVRLVKRPAPPPRPYGRACGPGHFLRIQRGIRVHKRLGRGSAP